MKSNRNVTQTFYLKPGQTVIAVKNYPATSVTTKHLQGVFQIYLYNASPATRKALRLLQDTPRSQVETRFSRDRCPDWQIKHPLQLIEWSNNRLCWQPPHLLFLPKEIEEDSLQRLRQRQAFDQLPFHLVALTSQLDGNLIWPTTAAPATYPNWRFLRLRPGKTLWLRMLG